MKQLMLLLAAMLLVSCATAGIDQKERSEHYKDGVFQNVNPVQMHSFGEIAWAGLTSDSPRAE